MTDTVLFVPTEYTVYFMDSNRAPETVQVEDDWDIEGKETVFYVRTAAGVTERVAFLTTEIAQIVRDRFSLRPASPAKGTSRSGAQKAGQGRRDPRDGRPGSRRAGDPRDQPAGRTAHGPKTGTRAEGLRTGTRREGRGTASQPR